MPQLRRRPNLRALLLRGPKRDWPRHRKFIRRMDCCVPGCGKGPIECAHVRTAANSGTGLKPPDWDAIPLCRSHHNEQHDRGVETFEARYKLDLMAIAQRCARHSPDMRMREAMASTDQPFGS